MHAHVKTRGVYTPTLNGVEGRHQQGEMLEYIYGYNCSNYAFPTRLTVYIVLVLVQTLAIQRFDLPSLIIPDYVCKSSRNV